MVYNKAERGILAFVVAVLFVLSLSDGIGVITGVARGAYFLLCVLILIVDARGLLTLREWKYAAQIFDSNHVITFAALTLTFPIWLVVYVARVWQHPYPKTLTPSDIFDMFDREMSATKTTDTKDTETP